MKMRLTPPVAAQGAWLIAGRSAAGAVLLAVTVSACTGGGVVGAVDLHADGPRDRALLVDRRGHAHPVADRPGLEIVHWLIASATSTARGGASASGTPHASSSSRSLEFRARVKLRPRVEFRDASSSAHASTLRRTPRVPRRRAPRRTRRPRVFPTAAPETGGGGTAGLQDGVLFGAGGMAVLVGFGTLAYRRRLSRKFAASPRPGDPAPRPRAQRPAIRDPATRRAASRREPARRQSHQPPHQSRTPSAA